MDFSADPPPFSRTFFEDIVDEKKFTDFINLEYSYHAALAGYTLDTSTSVLQDVHQCITRDIGRLSEPNLLTILSVLDILPIGFVATVQ